MPVTSSWLTAPRVRRLQDILGDIPERLPGLAEADAKLRLWRRCGGPIDELPQLLEVLLHAELIRRDKAVLRLTPVGRRAVSRSRSETRRPLALALIRAGMLHDQTRMFLDSFPADAGGNVTCRLADARGAAPQLTGLLQYWPGIRNGSTLTVPAALVAELTAVWALLAPPSGQRAELETRRKVIGNRAEAYSYQYTRIAAASPSAIKWVARDDDTLGYDLEDRATSPYRRIEVKGSGGLEPRFFMSDNEWRQAHDDPASYEIQFWGGIDLNRPVAEEYPILQAAGFPLVLHNVPSLHAAGMVMASPERWRVVALLTDSGSGAS